MRKLPNGLVEPTLLAQLPISAYHVSLAVDGDVVYLLSQKAAFKLIAGKPAQGIELDLGVGSVLTHSGFVFWSKGRILEAPKAGGLTREIARFPHQPQYLVASPNAFAWIDLSGDGAFTIQTLENRRPRPLVASQRELSGLTMIGDAVYFIDRPTDASYRFGMVRTSGGLPEYGVAHPGRRPSMLAAAEDVYYYDLEKSEIRRLVSGVAREETVLEGFVCSPIQVSTQIYCGCVEGLFEVGKTTRQPRVLYPSRAGSITAIASNEKMVAWAADLGGEQVGVYVLPTRGATTDHDP
ncbi:MAG TPA: hypothetical protein VKP30_17845 [Polyangiaceae bacterium]|nr:hypothetical protein [Polyangiaceae bacterium]